MLEAQLQEKIEQYETSLSGAHQKSTKTYHTRLGSINLVRRLFKTQTGFSHLVDLFLGLPSNGWLVSIQKLACTFGLETDFEHAAALLKETTHVHVTGKTLANQVEDLGTQMTIERRKTQVQEVAPRDSALFKTVAKKLKTKPRVYIGMDGVMVSMNRQQGHKEALVGVIFWEQDHQQISQKRKEIRHRHYVAMLGSKAQFAQELFMSYSELVGSAPCQVVALSDGARWIWDKVDEYYPDAIQILDFYHLSEYVWDAARELYPRDKKKRKAWAKRRLKSLKESKWKNVLKVLDKHPHFRGETKTAVGALSTYLYNNRCRVDYARYLQMGLMIWLRCRRKLEPMRRESAFKAFRNALVNTRC